MVWCNHCGKDVPGIRPYDGPLACNLCERILESFNFSTEVTFVKNAAGQNQSPFGDRFGYLFLKLLCFRMVFTDSPAKLGITYVFNGQLSGSAKSAV